MTTMTAPSQNAEQWMPVAVPEYFDAYEISTAGRVRRVKPYDTTHVGRECKQHESRGGYYQVTLSNNNRAKAFFVHRLVAITFVNKPDGCDVVNHLDGNHQNNDASNLEWTTTRGNNLHTTRVMGKRRGVMHGMAKLTEEKVLEIRHLLRSGIKQGVIAAMVGCHHTTVSLIKRGRQWSHVQEVSLGSN